MVAGSDEQIYFYDNITCLNRSKKLFEFAVASCLKAEFFLCLFYVSLLISVWLFIRLFFIRLTVVVCQNKSWILLWRRKRSGVIGTFIVQTILKYKVGLNPIWICIQIWFHLNCTVYFLENNIGNSSARLFQNGNFCRWVFLIRSEKYIPYTRHYNPLLIINWGFYAHISLFTT